MFAPKAVTLSTNKITLRPLSIEHLYAFYEAGQFPEIWRWSLPDKCTSIDTTTAWLAYSQTMAEKGEHVPFAIFDNQSGEFVGSTRYCSISADDHTLEIGFTFITPKRQKSYVNTHAKYCLLKHAFETLNANRVEFKVHEKNEKSRHAVTRIGATYEGILRNHRILSDGSIRNTVIFSIINDEWQCVKQHLEQKMVATYE